MKGCENDMKAMISQPMNGLTDDQINEIRQRAIKELQNGGYDVVDTFFTDEFFSKDSLKEKGVKQIPVYFLAKSLAAMSQCNAMYFCKGWEYARGCKIEHGVAVAYGIPIIYER